MDNTSAGGIPGSEFSAEALGEWTRHLEAILRGLAHALNNRASAVSAVMELAASGGEDDDPHTTRTILGTELERLTQLSGAVRSIGTPRPGGAEALSPRDVAEQAMAVLRLHADQRERVITIDARSAPPVRVPRWMLLRALVSLAATAASADNRATSLTLTLSEEDAGWLVTRVGTRDAPTSRYALELAAIMDGGALSDGCGFRVPTLAAVRQREGR